MIPNGGRSAFRDPKVVWDAARNRWVATITEGDRIGFYTSPDLKNWTRRSDFASTYGLLECPDLFQMRADDGTTHWVLGMSANGRAAGKPETYVYWTGTFDGTSFRADSSGRGGWITASTGTAGSPGRIRPRRWTGGSRWRG